MYNFHKSFRDCLKESEQEGLQKNLLQGNGFSIEINDKFRYVELLNKANFKNGALKEIFTICKTANFEEIIRKIRETDEISTAFREHECSSMRCPNIIESEEIIKDLKESFIACFTKCHPDSHYIDATKLKLAKNFILEFSQIYTLNYDLILYWIIMRINDDEKNRYRDGFSGKVWKGEYDSNVFYSHGALHFYINDLHETEKVLKGEKLLKEQILKNNVEKNIFPLVILEGSSEHKELAIRSSPYLNHCLNSLAKIKGCLFIHGVSFQENDNHIFKVIFTNKNLKKIYIGLHESDEIDVKARVEKLVRKYGSSIPIVYYDATSAFLNEEIIEQEAMEQEMV